MRLRLIVFVAVLVLVAEQAAAQRVSYGTAFSVAPELLITNQHVVDGCSSVDVISSHGRRTGSIAAADADIDLAILRASGMGGTTASLRTPSSVYLGEPVLVFGYPLTGALSSGGNFTSGLISALRGLRDSANQIQITSPIQPGNSGGPLMDSSGLVIGVVQSKLDSLKAAKALGDIPQNVNFAISLNALTQFLVKHKVDFRTGARAPALDTAGVAELAQEFTYRVECLLSDQRPKSAALPKAAIPTQERALLYEEDTADPMGRRFAGTAIWRTEAVRPGPDQAPELAIRADIAVPDRELAMTWTLRRNIDKSLPASHVIEITFKASSNFPPGNVSSVPGMLMKESEQTRGAPLAGRAIKVSTGSFQIGLSAVSADRERNLQLLQERTWLDIPVVYSDKRRAILAIAKGTAGMRAFDEAFAAWGRLNP